VSTDTDQTTINHLFSGEDAGQEVPTQPEQATPQELVGEEGQQPPPPDVEGQGLQGEETPPAEGQQQEEEQPRMVPLPELIETRKRAQEAERAAQTLQQRYQQLEQMVQGLYQQQAPQRQQQQEYADPYSQQQQGPVDPFDNPQAYAQAIAQQAAEHARNETRQQLLNEKLNESEQQARQSHGDEVVEEAFEAAQQAGIAQAFINKPDAYGELVRWHKANKLSSEIGDDPESYKKQLRDQIRQEVIAEMKQGQSPPSNLPPSLSQATKANTAPEAVPDGKDFFKEMMNKK
jgi:hypothetical protein